MANVRVLWIGEARREEFQPAAAWLAEVAELRQAATPEAAVVKLSSGDWHPEVILLATARPGQYSTPQIQWLRRAAPLSTIVALLGSWCEGELRTGHPLAGVVRVYWHQWPARAAQELARLLAGEPAVWSLPTTATEEERVEQTPAYEPPLGAPLAYARVDSAFSWSPKPTADQPGKGIADCANPAKGRAAAAGSSSTPNVSPPSASAVKRYAAAPAPLVAIDSSDADTSEALAQTLAAAGMPSVWLGTDREVRVSGVAAVVWDGAGIGKEEEASLRSLVARFPQAAMVALLDFPRLDECARARGAGVDRILSKPWINADLVWQLRDLLGMSPMETGHASTKRARTGVA